MFRHVGETVIRRSRIILLFWIAISVLANGMMGGWLNRLKVFPFTIPHWNDVAKTGEFQFLPGEMPSVKSSALFKKAFPNDLLTSSAVFVVTRSEGPLKMAEDHGHDEKGISDEKFVNEVLLPRIKSEIEEDKKERNLELTGEIITIEDPKIGNLLLSEDRQSMLVVVPFSTEFLDANNRPLINRLAELIDPIKSPLREQQPRGLEVSLSGSATVGRDMLDAQRESAESTEKWTVLLVIGLLLLIYRAPLLALIPLISVFISTQISLSLITLLGKYSNGLFEPFAGLQTYITVITYGAGVDYCLFLIARYKEELDRGVDHAHAMATTVDRVGAAILASASTVSVGIGMMWFAQFGKFQQAGICMAFSLVIMLIVSLSFTPALILIFKNWAFWPYGRTEDLSKNAGWISGASLFARLLDQLQLHKFWEWISLALMRSPGAIWLVFVLLMLPFAFIGYHYHGYMSYGLLSELPRTKESVVGAAALDKHFPAGNTAPLTVLLENPKLDFSEIDSLDHLVTLADKIAERRDEFGIADVRSLGHPLGLDREASGARRNAARMFYISREGEFDGHVTRLDLIFKEDPFSRDSIKQVESVEKLVQELLSPENPDNQKTVEEEEAEWEKKQDELDAAAESGKSKEGKDGNGKEEEPVVEEEFKPKSLKALVGSKVHLVGTTTSIRDLKTVTDQDQIVIDTLVMVTVYLILVMLLRRPSICAYLMVTVFFSYFVSLGATFAVFYAVDPMNFSGLDWKVPMFLFTILIAVGEDYNIFLMARIEEEQHHHGPVEGVKVAMIQTGSIISSCGIIMAGTFFSLVLAGSLAGSQQLGFALTFGVLLDTFIVRPILVPAYLIMLHRGRFGPFGKLLGSLHKPGSGTAGS